MSKDRPAEDTARGTGEAPPGAKRVRTRLFGHKPVSAGMRPGRGEPFVWLSGATAAIAIVMIVLLLVMLFVQGMETFWPRDIEMFEAGSGERLYGTVQLDRDLDLRDLPCKADGTPWTREDMPDPAPRELLIRQGNQDPKLYDSGKYFKWIKTDIPDSDAYRRLNPLGYRDMLLKRRRVHKAAIIERQEKGVLCGFVTAVKRGGGDLAVMTQSLAPVEAGDDQEASRAKLRGDPRVVAELDRVWNVFEHETRKVVELRAQRIDVETHDIGAVNWKLRKLDRKILRISKDFSDSEVVSAAVAEIQERFRFWTAEEPQMRFTLSAEGMKESFTFRNQQGDPETRYIAYAPGHFGELTGEWANLEAVSSPFSDACRVWVDRFTLSMNEWKDHFRHFDKTGEESEALANLERIQLERANLQGFEYAPLRYRSSRMDMLEHTVSYVFETPDGKSAEFSASEVVRSFRPNEMDTWDKLGVYFSRWWEFVSADPREANTEGGILKVIIGTLIMTVLMSIAVVPFGVITALYLREYAKQGFVVSTVRIAVNNLAGVPSIVFGIFGLGFFCIIVGGFIDDTFFSELLPTYPTFGGGGVLWASLTLALLTVPVVVVATEESLAAVPSSQREASMGCGASKFQTIWRVILPQSLPGILTGTILAMARGAGEVAPLMLVGAVKLAPDLPIDGNSPFIHLERKFMHLGFHIYDIGFQSPNVDNTKPLVFTTALVLIVLIFVLNIFAIRLRNKLRKKLTTSHV